MSANTGIAWTDHTFNPWWGCQRVSPGCEHCYAETFDHRLGGKHWGPQAERRFFGDAHWNEPRKWNKAAREAGVRKRVFCASMADVFEARDDLNGERLRLWQLIEETPWLDWQLLTKRPENVAKILTARWLENPRPNVWIGTTVEDQKRANERIPRLLRIPAAVRFLSVEPLLGPVDLVRVDGAVLPHFRGHKINALDKRINPAMGKPFEHVDWVIVGGESGHGARPMALEWARTVLAQCRAAGVAVFVKQLGGARDKRDDPEDWPEDLRVREFPAVRP